MVGDDVLVFKLLDGLHVPGTSVRLPRLRKIHRGLLVSFLAPTPARSVYLKRVVAVAGDTVEFRDGVLYVNGIKVIESYAPRSSRLPVIAPQQLRAGEIFVVGDNRDLSEDSRDFGPVSVDAVIGEPVAVLWSTSARTPDLLDSGGGIKFSFYWSALRHPVASTRWSRIGKLL